jgi:hypothetical protein
VAQYLYRIQPTRPATPREEEIISQHFVYLEGLTRQRVVILAGRTLNTDETSFGIVKNDPAVKLGVFRAELFPYRIALMAE